MSTTGPTFEAETMARGRRPLLGLVNRLSAAFVLALATAIVLPIPASAVPLPWKNCGSPTDHLRFTRVDASVWPPQRGHAITLTVSGTLDETVTGLGTSLRISAGGRPGFGVQTPVSPLRRPVSAGPFSKTVTLNVPSWIPSGFVVEIRFAATDQNDQELTCVDLTVPIK